VIADTGTSMLTAPHNELKILLSHLNVNEKCKGIENLPDLTFVISGTHYTLTSKEYVMMMGRDGEEREY